MVVVILASASLLTGYLLLHKGTNEPGSCQRTYSGTANFVTVADRTGFNGSVSHDATTNNPPWPVVCVTKGTSVTITVRNLDTQPHGFQITNYFDSRIETLDAGQAVTVSFIADKVGAFSIYCSIFCSIHIFMLNSQLRVLP